MKRLMTVVGGALFFAACTEIQRPRPEQFYGVAVPAAVRKELRWSNGKVPLSLDPARAAAAPETDVVRAVYEGLTELDGQTLEAVPALAEKWSASDDHRVWTFEIRKDARWTNGKRVTAEQVATSWQRALKLGKKAAHRELFQNIIGANLTAEESRSAQDFETMRSAVPSPTATAVPAIPGGASPPAEQAAANTPSTPTSVAKFGAEAISESTLRVRLRLPDKDFPKLVASPVFRPIYGTGEHFETEAINNGIVTNGPFRVALVSKEGVTLERSENYWNKDAVRLDGVRFVAKDSAEAALNAYRNGELDAVTNAELEPAAVKLLAPFEDFRQTRHSAINFYEVNTARGPFADRRVREALATAIDREKLIDAELEGATDPALTLLPLGAERKNALSFDPVRARDLLERAGFPDGYGFPVIRLVVNRNDTQQRVARTVAQMWKQQLNVETEIKIHETAEMDSVRAAGEYDLIRRGVVLPTADELVTLTALLGTVEKSPAPATNPETLAKPDSLPAERPNADPQVTPLEIAADPNVTSDLITADVALHDLTAIPLYFPISYALVKPYLKGFELNGLDAYTLQDVVINNEWKPEENRGR